MTVRLSRIMRYMEVARNPVLLAVVAAGILVLAGCDGGVSAAGDSQGQNETETFGAQDVSGSKSTYGKARDQAENIVEKHEQRQQEMLELMEPEDQDTEG